MSQLVWLEGKHTTQRAHCAVYPATQSGPGDRGAAQVKLRPARRQFPWENAGHAAACSNFSKRSALSEEILDLCTTGPPELWYADRHKRI